MVNFESMKVLLVTNHLYRIEADLLLQIDNAGYRVVVSEVGTYLQRDQELKASNNGESPGQADS